MPCHSTVAPFAVFALRGTIATTAAPTTGGVVPALSGKELLKGVPGLNALGVSLRVRDFHRVASASLTLSDLDALHAAIEAELDPGTVDGVVVVQGTGTIKESAFHLDLLHQGATPIVFTGAMRNPTLPGPDGPANLHAAIIAAAGPWLRDVGCVVVLGDEVHAARTVQKSHTVSTAAFTSPGSGPLGLLAEGKVRLHQGLPHRTVLPAGSKRRTTAGTVRVALHTVTVGDDGTVCWTCSTASARAWLSQPSAPATYRSGWCPDCAGSRAAFPSSSPHVSPTVRCSPAPTAIRDPNAT